MPNGFVGKSSQKYLEKVNKALSDSHTVHNKNPLDSIPKGSFNTHNMSMKYNYNAPYSPEEANYGSYITGVGSSSNIVISQNDYDEIIQNTRKVDSEIAEDLYRIAAQIEEMCNTIYIVPVTLPKYMEILNKVRSSLDEFQMLTDQTVMYTQSYVDEMMRIDAE